MLGLHVFFLAIKYPCSSLPSSWQHISISNLTNFTSNIIINFNPFTEKVMFKFHFTFSRNAKIRKTVSLQFRSADFNSVESSSVYVVRAMWNVPLRSILKRTNAAIHLLCSIQLYNKPNKRASLFIHTCMPLKITCLVSEDETDDCCKNAHH